MRASAPAATATFSVIDGLLSGTSKSDLYGRDAGHMRHSATFISDMGAHRQRGLINFASLALVKSRQPQPIEESRETRRIFVALC
jgi:hypothetical protein